MNAAKLHFERLISSANRPNWLPQDNIRLYAHIGGIVAQTTRKVIATNRQARHARSNAIDSTPRAGPVCPLSRLLLESDTNLRRERVKAPAPAGRVLGVSPRVIYIGSSVTAELW